MELTKKELNTLNEKCVGHGKMNRVHITTTNEIDSFLDDEVILDTSKEHRDRVIEEVSKSIIEGIMHVV